MNHGLQFGGSSAPAVVTMEWVTEYDNTFSDEGAVDLKALAGSTWEDSSGVVWDVACDANVSAYGVSATTGLGPSGAHGAGTLYAYLTATLADLVAAGGGAAYDPHADALEVYVVLGTLTGIVATGDFTYVNVLLHTSGNRYDGISGDAGVTNRLTSIDDAPQSAATTLTPDAGWTSGVLSWRIVGTKVGGRYVKNSTSTLDFDSATPIQSQTYLSAAVRLGSGNDDGTPARQLQLIHQILGSATKEVRITRLVVRRYRGVAS